MDKVITEDRSVTFYNERYAEHYHSLSGAEEEAVKKFAEQSDIPKFVEKDKQIDILDICFGLGYNSAAVIDKIRRYSKDVQVSVVGLENDKFILDKIKDINSNFISYSLIKEAASSLSACKDKISVNIILADALESIKMLDQRFDIILLDPFSPKKCPELWTLEFLKDVRKVCRDDAVLTTYSCARVVRDNLKAAGFSVKDGACVGRKAPSTVAFV